MSDGVVLGRVGGAARRRDWLPAEVVTRRLQAVLAAYLCPFE